MWKWVAIVVAAAVIIGVIMCEVMTGEDGARATAGWDQVEQMEERAVTEPRLVR